MVESMVEDANQDVAAGLKAWEGLQGAGSLQDREQVIRLVANHSLALAAKLVPGGEYVHYRVAKPQVTHARPGPDIVCRLSVKQTVYKANTLNGDDIVAYDVARTAMRILEDEYPQIISSALVVQKKRKLLLTSVQRAEEMADQGMLQCRGCGSFYATAHKGLYAHQHGSSVLACNEAGVARQAAESKDTEALFEVGSSCRCRCRRKCLGCAYFVCYIPCAM